ncbi:hypothetical protein GWP40_04280 [Treponema vincentii]|uniref:hypothetical protein n=1 Tax=Treponema vincentii TaxID=69710 RepID=UPI001BB0B53C|nr:hypothetical protein [Treponema vincentii]QUY17663.1 hypothetical protein GWP40_04280 [Treponema vincentii]
MKLKVLIIIFNTVLLTIFFTVLSFSFFTAGTEFIGSFFKNYWIFVLFFMILLLGMNMFFISNWKLITTLEAEDWPALSLYLETEIFEKHHLTAKKVRLLCEISILLGDFEILKRLERVLEKYKPEYIRTFGSRFAAAKLLSNDYQGLAGFMARIAGQPYKNSPWVSFYDAFSAQMLKRYREAAEKFSYVLETEQDPLVRLLSIYFMACGLYHYIDVSKDEVCTQIEEEKRKLKKHSLQHWKKYAQKEKQNIHVLVLTKAIDDALIWLFKEDDIKATPSETFVDTPALIR